MAGLFFKIRVLPPLLGRYRLLEYLCFLFRRHPIRICGACLFNFKN